MLVLPKGRCSLGCFKCKLTVVVIHLFFQKINLGILVSWASSSSSCNFQRSSSWNSFSGSSRPMLTTYLPVSSGEGRWLLNHSSRGEESKTSKSDLEARFASHSFFCCGPGGQCCCCRCCCCCCGCGCGCCCCCCCSGWCGCYCGACGCWLLCLVGVRCWLLAVGCLFLLFDVFAV